MTFSWEIDDIESLQGIVKRELKCLGIRISKKKDTTKSHHAHDLHASPLFGKALHTYPLARDETSLCHVPSFLLECTKFLDGHLNQEGIFRVSGSKSRQRDLQRNLENGCSIPDDANPADVCSLFKQFFRNLPEPLVTPRLQSAFLKSPQFEDPAERRWVVLNICYLLPPLNLQTLRFVARFLRRVAALSEHNRMDASNLAKVFTPNLMGASSTATADKKNLEKVIGLQTAVVQMMIENAKLIGEVPEWILDKVRSAGHSSSREYLDRLTSEDELEKSDDNLDEGSRPTRRRRRKSGSFQVLVSGLGHSLGILKTASSTDSILSDVTQSVESPKMVKRKATEDIGSAFTSTKRKAMLQKMTMDPQFCKPGLHLHKTHPHAPATPMTPIQQARPPLGEGDAVTAEGETLFRYGTPSIVYADDSFAGHTPSRLAGSEMAPAWKDERWQETPKSKLKRFKELSAKKLKRRSIMLNMDGDTSTTRSPKVNKTPVNKKRESKDVGWRLANASPPEGGLDTMKLFEQTVRPTPDFSSPYRKRKHLKAPSSPARLLTGPSPPRTRSQRLNSVGNQPAMSTPITQRRHPSGSSPDVVIVDIHSRQTESPKVVVVDTGMSGGKNFSEEYKKSQQAHASQLIGIKLGKERTSPKLQVPNATRQILKAAERAFASMSSEEGTTGETVAEVPKEQNSREPAQAISDKKMTPSVSQLSLSSVLSAISVSSHKSEFSHFGVEAPAIEDQQKTTYMETEICSPCVVECKINTLVADDEFAGESCMDSEKKDVDKTPVVLESISKDEVIDFSVGIQNPPTISSDDAVDSCRDWNKSQEDIPTEEITTMSKGAPTDGLTRLEHGREKLFKSDSLDSGKGHSMEDLHLEDAGIDRKEDAKPVIAQQGSMDAGLGDRSSEDEKEEERMNIEIPLDVHNQETVQEKLAEPEKLDSDDKMVVSDQVAEKKHCDIQSENNEIVYHGHSEKNEHGSGTIACKKSVDEATVTHSASDDVFKVPKSIDGSLSKVDMQNLINAALKSDMKKSDKDTKISERQNSSIVKANIQLFNSFSASHEDMRLIHRGRLSRGRGGSQEETQSQSKPLTPLTKSTSMDSGICNVRGSTKDLNDSFLAAIGGKKKTLSTSASMENISGPKQDLNTSYDKAVNVGCPIQGSQSMQNISTPTSHKHPTRKHRTKNVRSAQNSSTPRNTTDALSPSSIKRRRPVSQTQKTAFHESDSFARLRKQKTFADEPEGPVAPPVKPLGENNSPQVQRIRRAPPLDPRRATPLTPLHPPQRTRTRTPVNKRQGGIKHRSPVKPVKRLGKSPSPARTRQRSTPEDESRIHKRYPRSPKNPLDGSSTRSRRQTSAVPVHVQDEWEL